MHFHLCKRKTQESRNPVLLAHLITERAVLVGCTNRLMLNFLVRRGRLFRIAVHVVRGFITWKAYVLFLFIGHANQQVIDRCPFNFVPH